MPYGKLDELAINTIRTLAVCTCHFYPLCYPCCPAITSITTTTTTSYPAIAVKFCPVATTTSKQSHEIWQSNC